MRSEMKIHIYISFFEKLSPSQISHMIDANSQ